MSTPKSFASSLSRPFNACVHVYTMLASLSSTYFDARAVWCDEPFRASVQVIRRLGSSILGMILDIEASRDVGRHLNFCHNKYLRNTKIRNSGNQGGTTDTISVLILIFGTLDGKESNRERSD